VWKKVFNVYQMSIGIIIFLLIWEIVPRIGLVSTFILPPFSDVFVSFFSLLFSGDLVIDIGVSLSRAVSGFLLALLVGIPLGLFMGWNLKIEKYIDPLVQIFRNTPVTAMYPVFMMFFGLGELSKVSAIFWGCIWATLLNTISGVKSVDPNLIKAARSMGISEAKLFFKVLIPAASPSIVTGIRLSASTAIIILVAAEMLGGSAGVGIRIFSSQQLYKTTEMYVGVITIALMGVVINKLLVKFEKSVTFWKEVDR